MLPDKELVGFSHSFFPGSRTLEEIYAPGFRGIALSVRPDNSSGELLDLWAVWQLQNPLSIEVGLVNGDRFDALCVPISVTGGTGQMNLLERMPRSRRAGGFILAKTMGLQVKITGANLAEGDFLSIYGMAEDSGWPLPPATI